MMPSTNRKRKEIFKLGSLINKKIEFVEKSKVTNDEKSEEVSFLFIYYFKNFVTIKLVIYKLWILTLICVNIFWHI